MSAIREVEEKINVYAGTQPLSIIMAECLRVNDYPIDPILYADIITAFSSFYARVSDAKQYEKEKREYEDKDSE